MSQIQVAVIEEARLSLLFHKALSTLLTKLNSAAFTESEFLSSLETA